MNPFVCWLRRVLSRDTKRNVASHAGIRRRRCRVEVEALEERNLLSTSIEPINGVGNNVANPTQGSAGTDLLRISPVAYADGISAPSLATDPSARAISNIVNNQADPNNPGTDINTVDANNLSDFGYVWGQFIDHDMSLTPTSSGESLPITAPAGDPLGTEPFTRSSFDPTTGTSTSNPRQQVNAVTSFLDLSQVYGSDPTVADALRTHTGGLLKTSPGNLLPFNNSAYFTVAQLAALNMANDPQAVPSTSLFATGDVRGNENLELTALQTLFVRNHNRIAAILQKEHPTWTDEQLYQEARKLNIATEQMITYNNYLPDLLGPNALKAYTGYKPNVDAAIATEFSTVAFRFGHSLLSGNIERQGNNGFDIADVSSSGSSIPLSQDFFDPNLLSATGAVDPLTGHSSSNIDAVLKASSDGNSQAMDVLAINDVRNLLFGNGAAGGTDLIARDIQRARDDGIGTYNQVRVAYGSPASPRSRATSRFSKSCSRRTAPWTRSTRLREALPRITSPAPTWAPCSHASSSTSSPVCVTAIASSTSTNRSTRMSSTSSDRPTRWARSSRRTPASPTSRAMCLSSKRRSPVRFRSPTAVSRQASPNRVGRHYRATQGRQWRCAGNHGHRSCRAIRLQPAKWAQRDRQLHRDARDAHGRHADIAKPRNHPYQPR